MNQVATTGPLPAPDQYLARLLLSMSAGAVNAGAYLSCQRFVSHVTGTITLIGIDFGSWSRISEYALVLLCFLLGAGTAVFLLALRPATQYPTRSLRLVAFLIALAALLGYLGLFGPIGESVETPGDFLLLILLSFTMGLLNATVAASAAFGARVTHLTGHVTELGINLARACLSRGDERWRALRQGGLLANQLLCFAAGVTGMVLLVRWSGYVAFLTATGLTLGASELGRIAYTIADRAQHSLPKAPAEPSAEFRPQVPAVAKLDPAARRLVVVRFSPPASPHLSATNINGLKRPVTGTA